MLEGVSREAGPFEFVVCADGARMGRRERAWAGLCAWAGGWARGPGTVRAGQWTTGCAGLELCARASVWARGPVSGRVDPFTGSGNPFLRSWALLVAVWAACLGYHLWG